MKKNQRSLYSLLAEHYDELFPLDPAHLTFSTGLFGNREDLHLLDVGCATGEFAAVISRDHRVVGIDDSKDMICIAKKRRGETAAFQLLDMLRIGDVFSAESFDGVFCWGNTLVHLQGKEAIGRFFNSTRKVLKSQGFLAGQILNYDRILAKNAFELPLLGNDSLSFSRFYTVSEQQNEYLDFNAKLTLRSNGREEFFETITRLFPLLKDDLLLLLEGAGFSNIVFYGDYNGSLWNKESFLTVFTALYE